MGAPPPDEPRPGRPSLRGRGREILLGEHAKQPEPQPPAPPPVAQSGPEPEPDPPPAPRRPHLDPAALPLTPEERAALLDFSPASPAYHPETPLAAQPSRLRAAPVWPPEERIDYPLARETVLLKTGPAAADSTAPPEPPAAPFVDSDSLPWRQRPVPPSEDARNAAPAEVKHATSTEQELWTPPPRIRADVASQTPEPRLGESRPETPEDPDTAASDPARRLEDRTAPPGSALIQARPRALFDAAADREAAVLWVDDEKIRQLSAQIEALQEELVGKAEGDPHASDLFLGDLLQAGSLLRASRANYDDARALVYRVRADLNRQHRTEADIRRYRPRLVAYYVLWAIVLVGLYLLKARAIELLDRLGAGSAAVVYYPVLFGAAGALISSLFALERHTTKLRDFDPVHTSSYLVNPMLGGAIGAVTFGLASLANADLLHDEAETSEYAITYLLCLVAGMNQRHILRRLGDVLKRFGRG